MFAIRQCSKAYAGTGGLGAYAIEDIVMHAVILREAPCMMFTVRKDQKEVDVNHIEATAHALQTSQEDVYKQFRSLADAHASSSSSKTTATPERQRRLQTEARTSHSQYRSTAALKRDIRVISVLLQWLDRLMVAIDSVQSANPCLPD